ncbi:Cys-tRNA(Pro)/Cys-tRNA(Cys) deacylase [Staphylococcus auricularis]|mgnify:CR=1 FL=1|uniref:Cys-tRNA(Pro)/Cys-tRNA(Cys) deacylase n=1 Tax=Staphylococcus auricularis TaxID=29379 RepID=A0AAP8PQW0_9STAP|nr:Cys-tRNA(Pro) deacylase [Staphylococcus auricularis]MBM0868594.1 Cys-tRNA(Pro) deacylase [Staphylococcus auricularis]MCG7341823.1 Cys-tRNA(Pro) deacylase [Staphylococcus auricularis]MDC6327811.1 Cys-tRNA(Pro) deacylase [Staphylococcus auricularis]MDN4533996.1 Cys-tRNA(Pro) deacylase [Staphylococcus auricularis]PNZ69406.1 Cys-tRNA(Pro) deacylase [Staphylococcus auricularis]
MAKRKKTNAMRILDREKIDYIVNEYKVDEAHLDGVTVAHEVGVDESEVYKTLVLENANHEHFVFVIPVNQSLDMKVAAQAVNEKKLNLMPLEDLKRVTGYIRGGCSPIGMKKAFPTVIDTSAESKSSIYISGGERGTQIYIAVQDLIHLTHAQLSNVTQ